MGAIIWRGLWPPLLKLFRKSSFDSKMSIGDLTYTWDYKIMPREAWQKGLHCIINNAKQSKVRKPRYLSIQDCQMLFMKSRIPERITNLQCDNISLINLLTELCQNFFA